MNADTIPLESPAADSRESQQTKSAAPPARHRIDSRQSRRRISPQSQTTRVLTALAAVAAFALLGWYGYQGHGGKVAEGLHQAAPAENIKPVGEQSNKAQTITPIPTKRAAPSSQPIPSRTTPKSKLAASPAAARSRKRTCVAGGRCYTHRTPPKRVPSPYTEAAPASGGPTGNPTHGTVPSVRSP